MNFGGDYMYRVGNSVEQVFGGTVIKQGDRTPFGFMFRNENGEAVSLTNATVKIKIANEKALLLEKDATLTDEYTATFSLGQDDITGSGDMRLEFTVTYANGLQEKFPSDDWQRIRITPTLEDISKTGIAYLTFEKMKADFTQKVTDLNERVDNLVIEAGNSNPEIVEARGVFSSLKDKLADLFNKIINLFSRNPNCIGLMEYEYLKVAVAGGYDWSPVFDKAIEEAKKINGTVVAPFGNFDFYSTLKFIEMTNFAGAGEGTYGTVLNYKGPAGIWAIKTSGLHQRNKLSGFRLELNSKANGIMLGEYYANLPTGQVPITFDLSDISISGIGSSYTGMAIINASHYTCRKVNIGFGVTTGRGLYITADYYNSGVGTFIDCILGRVDANDIGLEISGTVNLDGFDFLNCYYGGKRPIKLGSSSTIIRNVNMSGHVEGRNTGNTVNLIEINNVIGGSIKGMTFAGFGAANTNAVVFKGSVEHMTIIPAEVNGVMEAVFKNDGATLVEDNMLQAGRLTNGSTATQFVGISDKNFKFSTRRFITENINAKTLYSVDGAIKEYWASAPDTTQGHSRGDTIKNTVPSRVKNITHWKCDGTGTPGTFIAYGTGWGTQAERDGLTLTSNDKGYLFKLTNGALTTNMWDGTQWI